LQISLHFHIQINMSLGKSSQCQFICIFTPKR